MKRKKTLQVLYSIAFILEIVNVDPDKVNEDLKIIQLTKAERRETDSLWAHYLFYFLPLPLKITSIYSHSFDY